MNHDSSVDTRDTRTDISSIPVVEATVCEIESKKINPESFSDHSNKRFRDGTFQYQGNSQFQTVDETSLPATNTAALSKTVNGQEIPVNNNTYKTRDQLLKLLDSMVLAFNVADFDIFAKTLSGSFTSNATVKIRLFPKETNPYFQTNMSLENNFTTTGISSVLLLWMLLHKTHPDGVMQIIDKRICYRQILHKPWVSAPAVAAVSNDYKESNITEGIPSSSPTATATVPPHTSPTVAAAPVSIIETVIKFTGSCITLHSIHELYCVLAEEGLALLTPQTPTGPESSTTSPPTTTAAAKQLRPEVFSEYISAFLAHELLSASSISAGTVDEQAGGDGWEGSLSTAAPNNTNRVNRYSIEIAPI